MTDALIVMWKEWKMLFRYRGGRMRFVLTMMTPVLLAFWVSWQAGRAWVEDPVPVFPTALVAILAVTIVIPESFAGERERRTLETLLSTPLSDASILFGKLGLAVVFAMVLAVQVLLLGLVTANIFHYRGTLLMYSTQNLILTLGLSFLFSMLVAALGVIISLRSETIQEATQTLAGIVLAPPILLGMLMITFRDEIVSFFSFLGRPISGLVVMASFGLLITGLLFEARRRFQRSRLLTL